MELKKSPSANLENKKLSFTLLGLVIVLAIVYIAVEWTNRDIKVAEGFEITEIVEDDELVPITIHDNTPPPPPPELPPPPAPVVADHFEVVKDDENVGDTPSFSSNPDAPIVIPPPPPPVVPVIADDPDEHTVFIVVEKMPSFPGGDVAMRKFISNNIKYPKIAEENGVEGRVVVSFVVGRTGEITDVEIMGDPDKHLAAEAIRIVKSMPKWTPGEQRGKPVKVKYVLPVVFKL